jgi:hypothetical protein
MIKHYQTLGVSPFAEWHEVEASYKALLSYWDPSHFESSPTLRGKAAANQATIKQAMRVLRRFRTGRELKYHISESELEYFSSRGMKALETGLVLAVTPTRRSAVALPKKSLFKQKRLQMGNPPKGIKKKGLSALLTKVDTVLVPAFNFVNVLSVLVLRTRVILIALIVIYVVAREMTFLKQ